MSGILHYKRFFGNTEFFVSETVLSEEKATRPHHHDFYEFFIVTGGYLTHNINNQEVRLRPDSLSFIVPEDSHGFCKSCGSSVRFTNVAITPGLFWRAAETYRACSGDNIAEWLAESENKVQLPAALSRALLLRTSFLTRGESSLFPLCKRDAMVSILLDCFIMLRSNTTDAREAPSWLTQACEALTLDQNYRHGLERFIELSGKSHEHVSRSMKRFYNTTPSAYVNNIRLHEAAKLLKESDNSVLHILLECGFNSVPHFNHLFKETFGVTPSRYRLLFKEGVTI